MRRTLWSLARACVAACGFFPFCALAAPELQVTPDRADWLYATGEPARFFVRVVDDGQGRAATVRGSLGPEKMPLAEQSFEIPAEGRWLDGGTLTQPGFLRLKLTGELDGKTVTQLCTVGFAPEKIAPTQTEPADFDEFWRAGLAELAAVPLDPQLTRQPELCTAEVEVFHVSFQNVRPAGSSGDFSRLHGMLCVPTGGGRYPAILSLPGAGVYRYSGARELARSGFITLELGIHGIPVNLPAELYAQLKAGSLNGYQFFNLDDRQKYYYRRVILGVVRGVDFIFSRPEFDGSRLGVIGSSQGGWLSLVTAALEPRARALACIHPAYSDVTGYLHGRAGGWPQLFRPRADGSRGRDATAEKIATTGYYDAVNFARRVRVPGFFSWGFNDEVCPPTSMFAAYNVVTAPKQFSPFVEAGHWVPPAQYDAVTQWLKATLTR